MRWRQPKGVILHASRGSHLRRNLATVALQAVDVVVISSVVVGVSEGLSNNSSEMETCTDSAWFLVVLHRPLVRGRVCVETREVRAQRKTKSPQGVWCRSSFVVVIQHAVHVVRSHTQRAVRRPLTTTPLTSRLPCRTGQSVNQTAADPLSILRSLNVRTLPSSRAHQFSSGSSRTRCIRAQPAVRSHTSPVVSGRVSISQRIALPVSESALSSVICGGWGGA